MNGPPEEATVDLDSDAFDRKISKYRSEIVALRDKYGREFFETENRESFAKAQVLQEVLNLLANILAADEP